MSKALRRLELGLCILCGGFPRSSHSTRLCEPCRVRRNARVKQQRVTRRATQVIGWARPEPQPERDVWIDGRCFQVVFDGRQELSSPTERHLDWVRYGAEL